MTDTNYRLQNVDALRGFALLGILSVNIWVFADPYYATGHPNPQHMGALDQAVRFMMALLFEAKFYLLFSFLFGYSFTLQMAAAERASAAFRPRMLRRQFALMALGILHGCLLFFGDILHLYGVLGLVLLAWRALEPARAVRRGIVLLVGAAMLWIGLGLLWQLAGISAGDHAGTEAALAGQGAAGSELLARIQAFHGDAATTRAYLTGQFPETMVMLLFVQAPGALAMFLFGFAAGRERLFEHVAQHQAAMHKLLRVALPVGLAGAAFYGATVTVLGGGGTEMIGLGVNYLTGPLLTMSYVILMLKLCDGPVGRALAPMGKLALTNYLGQSLLLCLIFTGYGLRLSDRLPYVVVAAIIPSIFLLQMATSRWWLRRRNYGPAEWLLRYMTNYDRHRQSVVG